MWCVGTVVWWWCWWRTQQCRGTCPCTRACNTCMCMPTRRGACQPDERDIAENINYATRQRSLRLSRHVSEHACMRARTRACMQHVHMRARCRLSLGRASTRTRLCSLKCAYRCVLYDCSVCARWVRARTCVYFSVHAYACQCTIVRRICAHVRARAGSVESASSVSSSCTAMTTRATSGASGLSRVQYATCAAYTHQTRMRSRAAASSRKSPKRRVCVHVCVCVRACVCSYACCRACARVRVRVAGACVCARVRVRVCACSCVHTHMRVRVHMCVRACVRVY